MKSVSDILQLLDHIPLWKSLKTLPDRVAKLEARLEEIERRNAKPAHIQTCAECGAEIQGTTITPHPEFAEVGIKQRTVTCVNGHSITYDWDPTEMT